MGTTWGKWSESENARTNDSGHGQGDLPPVHGDGETLYLRVTPGGSQSWIQRLTIKGKRRDLGLRGYPLVTLAEAREAAYANRRLARRGDDPVTDIRREDVLRVLTPIWTKKPEEARKLRRRIRAILRWSQAHGFVEHNAAGEAIEGALPRQPAVRAHLRSLPYKEIPAALETIERSPGSLAVKLCLRFTILTAVRSREARRATWAEIDRAERVWRIPAERMKAGAEHWVPLAEAVLDVLAEAEKLRDGSEWVLPSPVRVRLNSRLSAAPSVQVSDTLAPPSFYFISCSYGRSPFQRWDSSVRKCQTRV